tara:strand:+ start:352 stop:567 length:216 start_codon:yes stop_codon:yes gene_type:complete
MTVEFVTPDGSEARKVYLPSKHPQIGEEVDASYDQKVDGEMQTVRIAGTVDKLRWHLGKATEEHQIVIQLR